jgi:glycosyl transferase family 22 (putative mannosyltransferase)
MNWIKKLWEEKPLVLIIWIALILRLIAAVFSKGFGMHDDHFLVIEAAQSWVDGEDYNNWLPGSPGTHSPKGHSFLYVGINYLILSFFKLLSLEDPQLKMFFIRVMHAFYSLLLVVFSYKITLKLSNKKTARTTALLMAAFWFMPFLSVRNLVEVVCIPIMAWAIWLLVKPERQKLKFSPFIWAGILLGLAFSIRFQTLIFTGGVGLALLFQKKWKETIYVALGVLFSIFLVQGIIDSLIWGYPFAELFEYVRYNIDNAYNYNIIAWYSYLALVVGLLLPPISFFLVFGFFVNWRKNLILFLPTLLFFIFHSSFPNKQERFILPAIPFIIMLGMMGWNSFVAGSGFWKRHKGLLKASWAFFWILNLLLLPLITTMYSKKARAESMTYLSKYENIKCVVLENVNKGDVKLSPRFYLGEWIRETEVSQKRPIQVYQGNDSINHKGVPAFVLFFEDKNIDARVDSMRTILPNLEYETTIQPGFIDKVVYWMNPINANEVIFIYRNTDIEIKEKQ